MILLPAQTVSLFERCHFAATAPCATPREKALHCTSTYPYIMASDRSCARGALIVFEGGDRCGKTTQCSKLVEHLNSNGVSAIDSTIGTTAVPKQNPHRLS